MATTLKRVKLWTIVAVGSAAACMASLMPANAATVNQWRVSYTQTAGQGAFTDIAADNKTDAWAVGHLGTASYITHWNGTKWMTVRLSAVTGYQLDDVAATSPGNVWIFAQNNTGNWAFHYDGAHWHKIPVTDMDGEAVLGPTDLWTLGWAGCQAIVNGNDVNCSTIVAHWTGTAWSYGEINGQITALAGTSEANLWAVGRSTAPGTPNAGIAYNLSGGQWTPVSLPDPQAYELDDVTTTAAGDVWLTGSLLSGHHNVIALHKTASGWHQVTAPSTVRAHAWPAASDGHGGVWLSAGVHWTWQTWVNASGLLVPFSAPLARIPGMSGSAWSVRVGSGGHPQILIYGPLP